jgi:hypothetical protein
MDVALLTHLQPHEKLIIPNIHVYRIECFPGLKGGNAIAIRKSILHSHADLPPLVSAKATGVCIPIEVAKCHLRLSLNHRFAPGMTQISLCF